ncbi:MAG TPA: hypothetical protein VFX70_13925 [Mycobacteriales bacterium]|nr:hypothetical protein [Mycobacteriales bacterium]
MNATIRSLNWGVIAVRPGATHRRLPGTGGLTAPGMASREL